MWAGMCMCPVSKYFLVAGTHTVVPTYTRTAPAVAMEHDNMQKDEVYFETNKSGVLKRTSPVPQFLLLAMERQHVERRSLF
jgi:hypothetical protein